MKKMEAGYGQEENVPDTQLDLCLYIFKPHKKVGKLYEL